MKQRIRHLFPHEGAIQTDERIPRGWINPQGRFIQTKEHWASIYAHFRKLEVRSKSKEEADTEAAESERTAHLAYSLGWISVGHAGKVNAIGHQRAFRQSTNPALLTLRKLLKDVPAFSIQIELQLGDYIPSKGAHEDFDLKECDLDALIRWGKLRQSRQ